MSKNSKMYGALESVARGLSRQYGISVIFRGDRAYTDGRTIYIPVLSDNLTAEELDDIRAYIYHEVAHCLFTDFSLFARATKNSVAERDLLNFLCDIRIESEISKIYGGVGAFITALRNKIMLKTLDGVDKINPFAVVCFFLAETMRGHRHRELDQHPTLGPLLLSLSDRHTQELIKATSTKDIHDVCLRILQDVPDLAEDYNQKHPPQAPSPDSTEGEAEGGKSQADKSWGEEDGVAGDAASAEEDDGSKEDGSHEGLAAGSIEHFIHQSFSAIQKRDLDDKTKDATTVPTKVGAKISRRESLPTTTQFDEVIDLSGDPRLANQYADLRRQIMPIAGVVRNKIEQGLASQSLVHKISLQKKGKLDRKKLARFATDPEFTKPFYVKSESDHENTAVSILVDLSGSMAGHKIKHAQLAAAAMGEALRGMGINFEILGFESDYDNRMRDFSKNVVGSHFNRRRSILCHKIFKGFDSSSMSGVAAMRAGGFNADGESVMWAARRLGERLEPRKILFVLSDGLPSAEGDIVVLQDDLKTKIAKIEASGIECVGIGIGSNAVRKFYDQCIVLHSVKDLAAGCAQQLAEILLQKRR